MVGIAPNLAETAPNPVDIDPKMWSVSAKTRWKPPRTSEPSRAEIGMDLSKLGTATGSPGLRGAPAEALCVSLTL